MEYDVNIRRIVREDTTIRVTASSEEDALRLAKAEATNIPADKWECYDCNYWADDDAVEPVSKEASNG